MSITFGLWRASWNGVDYKVLTASDEYEEALKTYCNFANSNALDLMQLLSITPDYSGDIKHEELPKVMRSILRAKNVASRRKEYVRAPSESGGPGTGQCRVIDCGNSDDQILYRLNALEALVKKAIDEGYCLTWG